MSADLLRPATVDLHLHSRASDGDHTPEELARRAASAGVTVAACTDHDTLASADAFRTAFEALGGRCVTGCEVTTSWLGRETHLLVYGTLDPDFVRRVRRVHDDHLACLRQRVEAARDIGVPVSWEETEALVGADRIPYFGEILRLVQRKAAADERFAHYTPDTLLDLQRDWFEEGRPLYVPDPERPSLPEVIGWARAARGVPVLAHPARLLGQVPESADALPGLRDAGLAGLEAWTTWHSPAEVRTVLDLCSRLGLVPTQGSDFHGTRIKPWATGPGLVPDGGASDPQALVDVLLAA
ncbi:PHP domain-containing protein [Kitasatospora xanthocidica]|uniref:PHP domain-containing protein n=1 Tax=Kitasatospora xanthocidica TaxID=83382 RepID=A0A372ZHW4_9ACTN|nr:PHP domain-containing protein [Kitasatospora xanthocidica]RGD55439.1 PHP domain-containing protein [Kitasatospora xanthocidica]